jgi:integrase
MKINPADVEAKRLKLEHEMLEEQHALQNRLNSRTAAIISEKEQALESVISSNTVRSLEQAERHFRTFAGENSLPCSVDMLYNYLIYYSGELKVSTLEQRRRMIGLWHKKEGYDDPNDDKKIRILMRRIRKTYSEAPKQATPATQSTILQLDKLIQDDIKAVRRDMFKVDDSEFRGLLYLYRTLLRDRAMILTGFWFGLRSSELTQIKSSHLTFYKQAETPHFSLFIPKSKTDRDARGRTVKANAKPMLCAMQALLAWLDERSRIYTDNAGKLLSNRNGLSVESNEDFAVFSKVHWRGNVLDKPLKANSINPIIKPYFEKAGLGEEGFSSHSLRRGLANWLMDKNANLHDVMKHIGWTDVNTAMRYLDGKDALPDQILDELEKEDRMEKLMDYLIDSIQQLPKA